MARVEDIEPLSMFWTVPQDIGYNARYDVIDSVPGGQELRMCLQVKTSLGNIRRWRQDQCQSVGPFRCRQ